MKGGNRRTDHIWIIRRSDAWWTRMRYWSDADVTKKHDGVMVWYGGPHYWSFLWEPIGHRFITVCPKKYAHGFCFAVLCCGYTLTDFPISIRLTSLALWQSNECPSASKATLMNMDKYLMWIHYERLHNHNKAKHNKTVCIFLGIYCTFKIDQ